MVSPCNLCALCAKNYLLISTKTVGFTDNLIGLLYRLPPDLRNSFDLSQLSCAQAGNEKKERSVFEGQRSDEIKKAK
jgi:hypothetical protein